MRDQYEDAVNRSALEGRNSEKRKALLVKILGLGAIAAALGLAATQLEPRTSSHGQQSESVANGSVNPHQ